MSAPNLIRRELKNARLYFIPTGEVLALGNGSSSLTVGPTVVFPDNAPTTNWTDYELPDIEMVKSEVTVESETFKVPAANGGYREEVEDMVTRRSWKAETHKTSIYLKKLQHGLATIPVLGAAQAPGVNSDNFMDGVMLLEIQNKAGAIIERTQVWSRLRLISAGDVGPTTAKVEISLDMLANVYNTFVVVA